MKQEQELLRSEIVRSLSSIRDLSGSREEREEKLILAYTVYLVSHSHVHKLPFWSFRNIVDHMKMLLCTFCEKLGDSEEVLCCEARPRGVSAAFSGCGEFKAKAGMEEITRRWMSLS